ncbi:hypothetical protein AAC387_Pa01g2868 [Persea americana]|eukprot:TRINITY_DN5683_c0_g1_i3.p1 TRINITY_DN5683_c0_g1~~TRINITY_DN5683_c0_g1_i3.p1  ORF type:complete len:867 (-),score=171.33 TRINITY_DN5683_c0_g1_i3:689-3289(-)
MEGGGAEPDFDEIERLLGEIPNVTSGNTHPNESGLVASSTDLKMIPLEKGNGKSSPSGGFTDFYRGHQPGKQGSNPAFYSSLTFQRPTSMNSFTNPFNQKLHSDGSPDKVKISEQNEYKTPIADINQVESNLPDDQSLTSAFAGMSFKEGGEMESTAPGLVQYKTSPDRAILVDGQYSNSLTNSLLGLDSMGTVVSRTPNMLNSVNLVNPTSKFYPPFANVNGIGKFNGEMNSRESEMKMQIRGPIESFPSDNRGEQLQSLPVYPGAMSFPSGMHAPPMLTKAPVPGIDFAVPAFQQQYYLDAQSPYIQAQQPQQHLNGSHIAWRHMEEEQLCRMPQYFYLPQLQNHESELHPVQATTNLVMGSMTKGPRQSYTEMPITNQESFWNSNAVPVGFNQSDLTLAGSGLCHYHAQGLCEGGESCPYALGQKHTSATNSLTLCSAAISRKEFQGVHVLDKGVRQMFPEKILTRSHGLNSLKAIKPGNISGHESQNHVISNGRAFSNGHFPSLSNTIPFQLDGRSSRDSSPDNVDFRNTLRLQNQKYNSVDEVVGRIYLMAKDQHGCRFLQRKFTEGSSEDVQKIFVEIIGHIVELMIDPFGNYLVQKLLEVCDEDQRMQILQVVTRKSGDLIRISCDMHGTRAVQKVIETLKTPEQISMVVSSLKPGIVMMIKDMNGNHVAQRCLSYLLPEYSEFLFEAATAHCVDLATDRHGCCVLQKCLQHSGGEQKHRLMSEITSNALLLSQDPFGNYVVQYIIDQGIPWATDNVLDQLEGNYGYLSMQKYSSNVVEKCLKFSGDEQRARIIRELIDNSQLGQILQDPYGNYVVQSALAESKGAIHAAFVEAIRPHVPALRSSPYGKKVLSCNSLKK